MIHEATRTATRAHNRAATCRRPALLVPIAVLLLGACTPGAGPTRTGAGAFSTTEPAAAGSGGVVPAGNSADTTPTLGASDVLPNVGDRTSLAFCVNLPCPEKGSAEAPVTLIEILDYKCEYCAEHVRTTRPILIGEYVDTGKVRLVSHVYAELPPAQIVAAAAMCAGEQGKYFEFQGLAFERALADAGMEQQQGILDAGRVVGVESAAFAACVQEGRYLSLVQTSTTEAAQMGVRFTPSFIINGLMLEGAEDIGVFRMKIDQALAKAGGS